MSREVGECWVGRGSREMSREVGYYWVGRGR